MRETTPFEFPDIRAALGKIDLAEECIRAAGEEEGVLGIDIRDQKSHEEKALCPDALPERLDERGLFLREMGEAEFLDLRHDEPAALVLVFLGIGLDGLLRRHGQQRGADGEYLRGQLAGIDAGDFAEVLDDLAVRGGGGGGGEIERVRDDAGQEQPGDGLRNGDARLAVSRGRRWCSSSRRGCSRKGWGSRSSVPPIR